MSEKYKAIYDRSPIKIEMERLIERLRLLEEMEKHLEEARRIQRKSLIFQRK
jgi:hypothetical protein